MRVNQFIHMKLTILLYSCSCIMTMTFLLSVLLSFSVICFNIFRFFPFLFSCYVFSDILFEDVFVFETACLR
jgi:hypothetical protein